MNQTTLQKAAISYSKAGLSVLPVKGDKTPAVDSWKQFETTKPTMALLNQWFDGSTTKTAGLAIIGGKISGNLEIIDVDCKYDKSGSLMKDFCDLLKEHLPELFPKLVIAETVNGGFHIIYRTAEKIVEGNKKLASRPATTEEKRNGKKKRDLIESRGEAGYAVAAPTTGYKLVQGDYENIPTIAAEQREIIMTVARSFDQMPVEQSENERKAQTTISPNRATGELSTFEDFNQRADVPSLLEKHGWRLHQRSGSRLIYTRPGKTDQKASANWDESRRIFYVFTTSSAFESDRGYNPAGVFTILEHGGDYSASAKQLYADGYGVRWTPKNQITANLPESKLEISVSSAERGKHKVSVKTADGQILAVDSFNVSEADKRNKFIKQVESALTLSDSEKADFSSELLRLADEAGTLNGKQPEIAENFELIEPTGDKPAGVYFVEENTKIFICSPLEILAETQTQTGDNYGVLLRWADSKARVKTWAMPKALLYGDGQELARYLVSRGLLISTKRSHLEKLKSYINLSKPEKTVICTEKLGWNDGVYILPDETIGNAKHQIVYQPEYMPSHKFAVKGTLEGWQENISKYCVDNSRLAFGVSLAFASVLLPKIGVEGGGFHNRGGTSSGKTTASVIAGTVFGGSDDSLNYCHSWKATANGLESVAETHNHALLCLDELAQIDGRQAADVAYMLANGYGKIRQNKHITGRRSLAWQLLFLSTGEISLADKMNEVGLVSKGGQEVRLLDIPADSCKFGVFDELHGFDSGQSFADHLRLASRKYYGTPIREFLRKFIDVVLPELQSGWELFKESFINKILPKDKSYPTEVFRAAARFALVAFGGETATKLQITGWAQGEASKQTIRVFNDWFNNRSGRGSSDAERAISQVRAFIEAHGTSRFEVLTINDESLDTTKIINRAGFRKTNDAGEIDYLFLTESFRKEVCKGFDYKFVCSVLASRGLLRHDSSGYQKQLKYCGVQMRPYWVSSKILEDGQN